MTENKYYFRSKLFHYLNPFTNTVLDLCLDSSLECKKNW